MTNSTIEKSPSGRTLIRPGAEDDLYQVAMIYAPYVTDTVITFELEVPSADEWCRRYRAVIGAGLPFLVAEANGAVVGYAYCGPWKTRPAYRRTVEDSIYLAPESRGHGIGGLLLDRRLQSAAAAGVREVIAVIADTGDPASPGLHRSRGFTDAGRLSRVGHKLDRWVDTVLMQRSLAPSS